MSLELLLLLMIYAITHGIGVSFAYWAGWRARDRQLPPSASTADVRSYNLPPNYRPGYRSINYPNPSSDRRPTNPFNGERIPNPPPQEP